MAPEIGHGAGAAVTRSEEPDLGERLRVQQAAIRDGSMVIDLRGDEAVVTLRRPIPDGALWVNESQGLLAATKTQLILKRLFDVLGALVALTLLMPVLMASALAVVASSRGGIFFRQWRVGEAGQTFRMLKFRTMYRDAEARLRTLAPANEKDGPIFKIRRDPRVTPVGRHLRRWSLDETPQLLQVLTGKLSLVGPRPALPEEVVTYNPWERQRLLVRPGLTCIWQTNGRSELDFETWVRMDIDYIANWSPLLDVMLVVKTVGAVISGRGAY